MVASSSGADVFPLLVGQLVEDLPMGCVLLLSQSGSPTKLLLDIQLGNLTRLSLLDQTIILAWFPNQIAPGHPVGQPDQIISVRSKDNNPNWFQVHLPHNWYLGWMCPNFCRGQPLNSSNTKLYKCNNYYFFLSQHLIILLLVRRFRLQVSFLAARGEKSKTLVTEGKCFEE